jgi:hypothetical protein
MVDPIVSRASTPIITPGSGVSSFISAFHEAGGHLILGQTINWNAGHDSMLSDETLLMDSKQMSGLDASTVTPMWTPSVARCSLVLPL